MYALKTEQLSKVYARGKQALKSVSLEVPQGSFFALLGPNGAGKSTMINILADTVIPSSGVVQVLGRNMQIDPLWCKQRMGIVPQEVAFDPFFTPYEVLNIFSGLYGARPDRVWIDTLLDRLELAEHAHKNTRELSGGMKRRLLVAQALVHKPELVVLDEPTAGVDVELRKRLWDFMRELNQAGTTILLTTHYLEEAQELCDHVAILNEGELLLSGRMDALLRDVAGRSVWFEFAQPLQLSATQQEVFARFNPRIEGHRLILATTHHQQASSFHDAYMLVHHHFGAPVDVSIDQEDLEDVFLRMTRKHQ
ncbi:MAG: ABC transporter ATP-binding protein [Zetaproteobacteria bacterium]|nr:ABC transporter ATP-binding protein [Zetaproteobacteria bacterium]